MIITLLCNFKEYKYIYTPSSRVTNKNGDLKVFVNRISFVKRVFDKSFTNQIHLVNKRSYRTLKF